MHALEGQLQPAQPQRVITHAAQMLSSLSSNFVGVITAPRKPSVFRHIEFLRLGERRVLVILVSPDGDVQNRVIMTAQDHDQTELTEAANRLNAQYTGLTLEVVRERLRMEVEQLRGEIAGLMNAGRAGVRRGRRLEQEQVVISGERNLLSGAGLRPGPQQPAPPVRPVRGKGPADAPA